MKVLTTITIVFFMWMTCEAGQDTVQYAKTRNIASLSGTVTDAAGEAIPNVRVCTTTSKWKDDLQCTMTDSGGRWSLPSATSTSTYHLRFVKDGFDQVWIRVRLTSRKSAPFVIELPVAT